MKKKFVKINNSERVLAVYDIYKISYVFRYCDTGIRVIIDGNDEIWDFDNKETCEANFNWIVNELMKFNNNKE